MCMGIRRVLRKVKRMCEREVKKPVYIPVFEGSVLQGKTVLITGGAGGIGYAIASRAVANGAEVVLTGRNKESLIEACNTLRKESEVCSGVYYIVMDVRESNRLGKDILDAAELTSGKKIDILVNNAGISSGESIGSTLEEDYDETMETNLKGTYFMCQEFSQYLIKNNIKGNILNVSSTSGRRPAISPYMLSKWGIAGLTSGLAKKLIKHDIVVNGIAPGPTATGMLGKNSDDLSYVGSPAQRYLDATEVANLAIFLMSDMGRMIVGETVYISGGCGTLTFDDIEY